MKAINLDTAYSLLSIGTLPSKLESCCLWIIGKLHIFLPFQIYKTDFSILHFQTVEVVYVWAIYINFPIFYWNPHHAYDWNIELDCNRFKFRKQFLSFRSDKIQIIYVDNISIPLLMPSFYCGYNSRK